jgi:MFS family permease
MASRYSLKKRLNKEFIKDRAKRILLPSIFGIFAYGWIAGIITSKYVDVFGGKGNSIPDFIKYLIYCLMGTGPLWFCQVLFIACLLLIFVKKLDKKDKLLEFGKKVNTIALLILVMFVWGSSFVLNAPVITVYRFGIYLFMFFLGYYVFSHDEVMERVKKISIPLGIISAVTGIIYVLFYYGTNYTEDSCLQSIFTNIYLWISILSILGLGNKYLNFNNKFSNYMTKNNFNFYILHYTIILILGYLVVTYLHLSFALNYLIIIVGTMLFLPLMIEIIKRIPIINKLLLGR